MNHRRVRTLIVAAAIGLVAAGAEFVVPALPSMTVSTPFTQAIVALMPHTDNAYAADPGQGGSRKARSRRACACPGSP